MACSPFFFALFLIVLFLFVALSCRNSLCSVSFWALLRFCFFVYFLFLVLSPLICAFPYKIGAQTLAGDNKPVRFNFSPQCGQHAPSPNI